jgi:hypothetical protein
VISTTEADCCDEPAASSDLYRRALDSRREHFERRQGLAERDGEGWRKIGGDRLGAHQVGGGELVERGDEPQTVGLLRRPQGEAAADRRQGECDHRREDEQRRGRAPGGDILRFGDDDEDDGEQGKPHRGRGHGAAQGVAVKHGRPRPLGP